MQGLLACGRAQMIRAVARGRAQTPKNTPLDLAATQDRLLETAA
jgi:hypothetical protein